MNSERSVFFSRIILMGFVLAVSYFQARGFFEVGGVSFNAAAAFLLAVSLLEEELAVLVIYILGSIFFLSPEPVFTAHMAVFGLAVVFFHFLSRLARWPKSIFILSAAPIFTLFFYFLTTPSFIFGNLPLILYEAVINTSLAFIFYKFVESLYGLDKN